jgi:hypothetical protein
LRRWLVVGLITATVGWYALESWAAGVSTYPFGRYEIVLQEGTPVTMGEILGMVRRQTGLPEYPLMLAVQKRLLELNLLGPSSRPHPLASTEFSGPAMARGGPARFILQRTVQQGEVLTLQFRHASLPVHASLQIDLRRLERTLEGER